MGNCDNINHICNKCFHKKSLCKECFKPKQPNQYLYCNDCFYIQSKININKTKIKFKKNIYNVLEINKVPLKKEFVKIFSLLEKNI